MASGRDLAGKRLLRRPRALVVESDSQIAASIEDTLFSIGHDYDVATNRWDARRMLTQTAYSYVLLNLRIPARPHRGVATPEFSMLLLDDVRKSNGSKLVPTIVMAERDPAYFEMIGELVAHGASEFVTIPFPHTGHTLSKAIRGVFTRQELPRRNGHRRLRTAETNGATRPFRAGTLVFFPTRVELCGVKICDGGSLARAILDALREKDPRGRFVALSGEELARRAGNAMTRQNDIADAVRRLRRRIEKVMPEQANIQCGRQDVITNDRKYGYSFSPKIAVGDADDVKNDLRNARNDVRNDVNEVGNDVRNDPNDLNSPSDEVGNLGDRQQWILAELQANGQMCKGEVLQGYRKRFCRSKTTLERDLEELRRHGLVRFDGEKRTGRWRLA